MPLGARRISETDAGSEVLLLRLGSKKVSTPGTSARLFSANSFIDLRDAGELVAQSQIQREIAVGLPVVVGEAVEAMWLPEYGLPPTLRCARTSGT